MQESNHNVGSHEQKCQSFVIQIRHQPSFTTSIYEKSFLYLSQVVLTKVKEHNRWQLKVLIDDIVCMFVVDHGYLEYDCFYRMMDTILSPDFKKRCCPDFGYVLCSRIF